MVLFDSFNVKQLMNYLTKQFFLFIAIFLACQANATNIKGAGSSAAAPLYESWAKAYLAVTNDGVNYDPVGSGAGLKKVRDHSVDFGASDIAIRSADIDNAALICVPTSVTGIVPFVNIAGLKPGQLNLNGVVLADIYQGKIKSWNDGAIAALNPGRSLPNLPIRAVGRIEGSGTTYIFTDYLSKSSATWHDNFGTNLVIPWGDQVTKAKGSVGLVAEVNKINGSIGYVDYGYILSEHLTYVTLQNHDKVLVEPSFNGFNAALSNSNWKTQGNFEEMLTDKAGNSTWPITSGTFFLIPRVTSDPAKTIVALKFLTWGFLHGDEIARKLGYVRLIDPLQAKVFGILMTVKDKDGHPLTWSPF